MPRRALIAVSCLALLGASISVDPLPARRSAAERIETHDNERAAGTLHDGVLALSLEARTGSWYPHGTESPGTEVPALAEGGGRLRIPSPMIRVPAGTEVFVTVTNSLPDVLTLHGLESRPVSAGPSGGVRIEAGATRQLRFRLDAPGTYYYWGTTMGRSLMFRTKEDAQLSGAIVVDEPGAPSPRDRVLLIGQWSDTTPNELLRDIDMQRFLLVVNGRSWPHTERLSYTVGDTVRWRLINTSAAIHPMHLHGFHFTVDSRGDGRSDTTYAGDGRMLAVTERMRGGDTFTMTWVPERQGNWLFHCHLTSHFSPRGPLGEKVDEAAIAMRASHSRNHAEESMTGLVVGVRVGLNRSGANTRIDAVPRQRVRMLVRTAVGGTERAPSFSVALEEGGVVQTVDEDLRAGPPLVLERGVPASITVVNRTSAATSIHWHGIELDSYFDGVAGFSGSGRRLSPLIAAGDSFEVRITPPRAGTFIYHTHADEINQQPAGLSGALIVVERGARWDPATDMPVLITTPRDSADERRAVLVNGSLTPAPLTVRVGVPHRLRLINITTGRPAISAELRRDTTMVAWRAIAKDGADLPPSRQREAPARQPISVGETVDVLFTPTEAGEHRLEVKTALGATLAVLPITAVHGVGN